MNKQHDLISSQCHPDPGIDVTAVVRLKHADLWKAAKVMGSQSALARYLGIRPSEIREWINLQRVPPSKPVGSRRWTEEYICELEGKLALLTGKSWEDLFPESLRQNAEFLECSKTIEKTATMEAIAMEHYATASRQRLTSGANYTVAARRAAIEKALESCDERDAKIVRLRFGLDGNPKTYEEIGKYFGVTRERVRQLEQRAVRNMQRPEVSERLEEYA